jgi:hypothetical protein
MYFITADPADPDLALPPRVLWVEVDFLGDPSGQFHLGLSADAASVTAENFLGLESALDAESPEARNVALEMANVICGAALSRLESDRTFRLSTPRLLDAGPPERAGALVCLLPLECGAAEARFWFDDASA